MASARVGTTLGTPDRSANALRKTSAYSTESVTCIATAGKPTAALCRVSGQRLQAHSGKIRACAERESSPQDDRQRPHGIMEQVHEVRHVPPPSLHQRARAQRRRTQLHRFLQQSTITPVSYTHL